MKWFVKCIKNYANFKGRARRAEYWYFILFAMIIYVVAAIVDQIVFGRPSAFFYYAAALFLFIPNLAVMVRRLHDTGRSGKIVLWYYLAAFAYIIALLVAGASYLTASMQGISVPMPSVGFLVICIGGVLGFMVWGIFFLVWFCTSGNKGDNKYGPDPKEIVE